MKGEWRTSNTPDDLIELLGVAPSRRKALLVGVACLRCVAEWDFFNEPQAAMRTAELWADGSLADEAARAAYLAVCERRDAAGRMILGDPDADEPNPGTAACFTIVAAAALLAPERPPFVLRSTLDSCRQVIWHSSPSRRGQRVRNESQAQCDLIRDIFGNPFRPVAFSPSWRTEAVIALARGMYESRDFGPMPVLADALDDAGCDQPDILAHCRGPGPHVRGCWVVDLVLGKA